MNYAEKNRTPRYAQSKYFNSFWTEGSGRELIDWSGAQVSLTDFSSKMPLYYEVDTLSDQVVEEFYFTQSYADASARMDSFLRNGIPQNGNIPDVVTRLIRQSEEIPHWLDRRLLKAGADNSMRAGLNAFIALRDYSLMGGYVFASLNKPLIITGTLRKGAIKRLSETLDFWVNVTRHNAMEVHGKGYQHAVKTRLIHSFARLQIKEHAADWDTENLGEPINLWDMTATAIGFTLIYLHGLHKLGFKTTPAEEAGIFHLWKYVGYLMGIPPEILPDNKKEATKNFYLWTANQPAADEDSIALAQSLVQESLDNPILKYEFQRKILKYIHVSCAEFLLDEETFRQLRLPKVWNKDLFTKTLLFANKAQQRIWSRTKQIEKGNKAQLSVLQDYLTINKKSAVLPTR